MPKVSHQISIPGLELNRASKIPAYKQVYGLLRTAILDHRLQPGQRLPSSRLLAESMGVSRNIILLAYEQLSLEGFIAGATGNGSFVSGTLPDTKPKLPKDTVSPEEKNIASNVTFQYPVSDSLMQRESEAATIKPFQNPEPAMDHFPYRTWAKCAYRIFRNLEFESLNYHDAKGYLPLRTVIADYLRVNRAIRCGPEQIVITTGTQQALNLAAAMLLKNNDRFWIEDPGYINARAVFEHAGGKTCPIPVHADGMDVDHAMQKHPNATLCYITPSHQFPAGGTLSITKRLKLLEWAAKKKMWIIEDDYDSEFQYGSNPVPALQGLDPHKRVIYMGTFSKVLFPGLRIGYIILPDKEMADAFGYAKAFADRQNGITDQLILHEFIHGDHLTIHIRRMRQLYKKRQEILLELIQRLGEELLQADKQSGGMHVLAWLPKGMNDQEVTDMLRLGGVYVAPLSRYTLKYKQPPALILGYTAFNEKLLAQGVRTMVRMISEQASLLS
ncbi:PLP-dependent aminotransferase family protein [Chitinophaga barathri]|uniref:PLP-dependent aminotransferase family protein n=1 Tax=Chitinophaga barathri TaxID=1647451 RepID=A0A3N4N1G5_9BACT|nr:PLP-dependent aminotransferase family protein [Chitinophaga barathri]RPD41453.1 PLP-dependent aminotransferase family protein [Chitinophaga barathri]